MEVDLDFNHTYLFDLAVRITSPSGTTSVLYDQAPIANGRIDFTTSTVQFWGEDSGGTWTLDIVDEYAQDSGTLYDWGIRAYGNLDTANDTYFYTDEWGRHGGESGRGTLTDTTGIDTLNFAAVTAALDLSLMPGASNTFMGYPISIFASTTIENAYGGDAGDTISGNTSDNTLYGMRGSDTLSGGEGSDILVGGAGDDRLFGGAGSDTAQYSGNAATYTITRDGSTTTIVGGDGTDVLTDVERAQFADQTVTLDGVLAGNDTVTATEDTALIIPAANLLANDSGVNGRTLTITGVGAASNGIVTINGDGNIVYTPSADYSGTDSFTYTVDDGNGNSDTATVTVNVTPVADTPTVSASIGNWTVSTPSGEITAGTEFRVNTLDSPTGQHAIAMPTICSLANGGYVVAWNTSGLDGDAYGVFAQRYDGFGNPSGTQFQVNSHTPSSQLYPSIAALDTGGFVVTWQSNNQDGEYNGIFGQRYGADGSTQGNEFRVNSTTSSGQERPSVAGLTDGEFAVVWQSNNQDGEYYGIFGQRYDAAGAPQGGEFQVNTHTDGTQSAPAITTLQSGGFVVTWVSYHQDGDNGGIYGQRYDSNGVEQGGEFRINTHTHSTQLMPAVVGLADRGFVVVWSSHLQDGSHYGVYGQRFNEFGQTVGSEFRVNTYTDHYQYNPAVAALDGGGFVVTWDSNGQDGQYYGIYGQRYDNTGARDGDEFRVNSHTSGSQSYSAVTGHGVIAAAALPGVPEVR